MSEKGHEKIAQRLANYGLDEYEGKLPNISIPNGQQLIMSPNMDAIKGYLVTLKPRSPHDFKRWLGVPNEAFQRPTMVGVAGKKPESRKPGCPIFVPLPPIPTDNPEMLSNLARVLVSDTRAASEFEISALHKYMVRVDLSILAIVCWRHIRICGCEPCAWRQSNSSSRDI